MWPANDQRLTSLVRGTLFALAFGVGIVAGWARPGWVRAPGSDRHAAGAPVSERPPAGPERPRA